MCGKKLLITMWLMGRCDIQLVVATTFSVIELANERLQTAYVRHETDRQTTLGIWPAGRRRYVRHGVIQHSGHHVCRARGRADRHRRPYHRFSRPDVYPVAGTDDWDRWGLNSIPRPGGEGH